MNIGKLKTSSNNLIGLKFHELTVIEVTSERTNSGSIKWLCECSCGNTKVAAGNELKRGGVKSCGCKRNEANITNLKSRTGSRNPSWKGGKKNVGSYAWASAKLSQAKCVDEGIAKDVSVEEYLELINSSNGVCEICGISETENHRRHCVDHNHETGELRGILCASCNAGIGVFHDSIEKLEKAIEYLKSKQNEHR